MNQVQVFSSNQFGEIRTIERNGEPWFVAADVCKALEIVNNRMATDRLDEDEKNTVSLTDGNRGNPNTVIINEPGLYSLVLSSRKPEAKQFKRWITHEVIPSIRRNGGYIAGQETLSDEDLLSRALMVAQRKIDEKTAQLAAAHAQIEAERPKVIFADAVSSSGTSILIRELAKLLTQNGYSTGERRLYEKLRSDGYLIKGGSDYNLPTQRSMNMGLFEIKETVIHDSMGNSKISRTPKVTGKGQQYFINKFLQEVPHERKTGNA